MHTVRDSGEDAEVIERAGQQERHDRLVERVLVVGSERAAVEAACREVRRFSSEYGYPLEVWRADGLDAALSLLDRYIDVIVLVYPGLPHAAPAPLVRELRRRYGGRMVMINDDPELDSCGWGRHYQVDVHLEDTARLVETLARLLLQPRKRGSTALVLAGGGILGGFNEAGSLKALRDFGITDFDMYIGISAGSVIGSLAANGATPEELLEHKALGLTQFYFPNLAEAAHKVLAFLPAAVRRGAEYLRLEHRDGLFLLSSLFTTSAILSNRRIAERLADIFAYKGGTNSFRELRERGKRLFVMAVDMDAATTRVFGADDDLDVPISQAVAASCALPLAYAPVRIDGRDYLDGAVARTAGVDVAVEQGADLIVVVNPLVPYTGGDAGYIKSLGVLGVAEQTYRILLQQRLRQTIEFYRYTRPDIAILLIEPDTDDPTMFHNPLNAAEGLIELAAMHGYRSTRRTIEARFDFMKRAFYHHGRPITREVADEEFDVVVDRDVSLDMLGRVLRRSRSGMSLRVFE
ncbi:MAG: hypothetical protein D6776_06620 [Planctomycetota bacterium]|nr:MAG: hypothetical protein D6776_06620 [Planctomycetota bacterium]